MMLPNSKPRITKTCKIAVHNPLVILILMCLFAHPISTYLVEPLLMSLFFESEQGFFILFNQRGFCGPYNGTGDIGVIICRLFYPKSIIVFIYTRYFLLGFMVWAGMSIASGRILWVLSNRQRWILIATILLTSGLIVVYEIGNIPEMFLFTGPIHGFHPAKPLFNSISEFITPLLMWLLIDKLCVYSTKQGAASV